MRGGRGASTGRANRPSCWLLTAVLCLLTGSPLLAQESVPPTYDELLERLQTVEARLNAIEAAPANDITGLQSPSTPTPGEDAMPTPGESTLPAPGTTYPNVKINGFFQVDAIWFGQSPENREQLGNIQDGVDFRRTRLSAGGSVAENVNYFVQLDFAFFGRPTFTDIWGEITDVPRLGTVRVGQWKQPFSLEAPTSVRYQTFLERSLLFQTFEAFRHTGIGFYNHSDDDNWTWALSAFRTGQDQYGGDIGDPGGWSAAGRLTHLLYYEETADLSPTLDYLHIGSSFWWGDPDNDRFRYATIPEAYVGEFGVRAADVPGSSRVAVPSIADGTPPFVDTGIIFTNSFAHVGTECVWARGPFTWQSEVQMANVVQTGGPQLHFWGFYTQWMYFLTGESRPYHRGLGVLERITPRRPFIRQANCEQGPGAWEVAMRVSHVDLDDENIAGGRLTDLTAGVNWYLNGYTKVQFNYIRAMLNRDFNNYNGPSDCNIYGIRFQLDF